MRARGSSGQWGRLVRACAILLSCILVPALTGSIAQSKLIDPMSATDVPHVSLAQTLDSIAEPSKAEANARGIVASQVTSSLSHEVRSAFDQEISVAELPASITAEIALPTSIEKCLFDQSTEVIGYFGTLDVDGELAALRSSMEAVGWRAVPLGGVSGISFVKDDGAHRFALSTATQVDGAALVVVRLAV